MHRSAAILVILTSLACGKKDRDQPSEKVAAPPAPGKPQRKPEPRPPVDPRVDTLTRCLADVGARDPDPATCYRDDAVITLVDARPPMYARGGHGVLALYRPWRESFPDLVHQLGTILVSGDQAVVTFAIHGTNTAAFQGTPATKHSIGLLGAQHVRLTGGKIQNLDIYVDLSAMLGQLGLLPPGSAFRSVAQKGGQGQTRAVIGRGDDAEKGNQAVVDTIEAALARSAVDEALAAFTAEARFIYVPGATDAAGTVNLKRELAAWRKRVGVTPAALWTMAAGDRVAVGTQAGPGTGLRELHLYALAGGKVTELWIYGSPPLLPVKVPPPRPPAPPHRPGR